MRTIICLKTAKKTEDLLNYRIPAEWRDRVRIHTHT